MPTALERPGRPLGRGFSMDRAPGPRRNDPAGHTRAWLNPRAGVRRCGRHRRCRHARSSRVAEPDVTPG